MEVAMRVMAVVASVTVVPEMAIEVAMTEVAGRVRAAAGKVAATVMVEEEMAMEGMVMYTRHTRDS